MNSEADFLREDYNIETPENVTFGFEVAGIGSRFIGALIDTALWLVALLVAEISLAMLIGLLSDSIDQGGAAPALSNFVRALSIVLVFVIFWGYYILFELLWNGQTPGKRAARTRVLRGDGNPAGFVEIVVRNLVRFVDWMLFGYALGLVVMFFNRQARRLGDYAAGTIVVKERRDIALDSLRPAAAIAQPPGPDPGADALAQSYPGIDRLTTSDYDLIIQTLDRERGGLLAPTLLLRLGTAIAAKLDCPRPRNDAEARALLRGAAESYRGRGH